MRSRSQRVAKSFFFSLSLSLSLSLGGSNFFFEGKTLPEKILVCLVVLFIATTFGT